MTFAAYIQLAKQHTRFIAFGFLIAFASSFGQTYFIGIFGSGIQAEFGLSHTAWGTIYLIGTLASALLMPWTGRLIDHIFLPRYTLWVIAAFVGACLFMSQVVGTITLVIAIFLLRQTGQGLMSHTAVTSMARYFDAERGRSIALATLGFAAGEAILPFLAVIAIAAIGWRWSYTGAALVLLLVIMPVTMCLLKDHDKRHQNYLQKHASNSSNHSGDTSSWTSGQMLRDPRFQLMLPGILAPSIIITAMFFHHLNLADAKGWSHQWITGSYIVYAAATTFTSLIAGPLIDRFSATRLVPFMLGPLVASMIVVAWFENPWVVWLYLGLAGIHVGIAHTAVSAMWAEVYGVMHLGAIKSLVHALTVFGSALGPAIVGTLVDAGLTIDSVYLIFAAYSLIGAVLITIALRKS